MKKAIICSVITIACLYPTIGNAFIDTGVSSANAVLEGYEPYRKLENEVKAYKEEGDKYSTELTSEILSTYIDAIEKTASEGEMDYIKGKLNMKAPFSLDDGKWIESFLVRVQDRLKNDYIPTYNQTFKTYSENFCKAQVSREEKINTLIDELDTLSAGSKIAKAGMFVKTYGKNNVKNKWNDIKTKRDKFTQFDKKYGCSLYKGEQMGVGQPARVSDDKKFFEFTKKSQLTNMQDILKKFRNSKVKDRAMLATSFKRVMNEYLKK